MDERVPTTTSSRAGHLILKWITIFLWVVTVAVYVTVIVMNVTKQGDPQWDAFRDGSGGKILIGVMITLPYMALFLSLMLYLKSQKARAQ